MNTSTKLQTLLNIGVNRYPENTAINFHDRSYRYRELQQLTQKLAYGLQETGIVSGDRVALLLPNCPEAAMAFLACYQLGAIAVPLNYRYQSEEARYVIEQTGVKLILCHADRCHIVDSLKGLFTGTNVFMLKTPTIANQYRNIQQLFECPELTEYSQLQEQHPAFILYTSGSTGKPKGVTHSHHSAFSAIQISRQALDFISQDVVLVGKPISHAGGLQTQLMPALLVGAQVILTMKPSPAEAVKLIKQYAVSEYGLLASDLLDFIEYLEANPCSLPSLNNSIGSGDSVPIELHHRFRDLFDWEVLEGCGMTEVGCYYSMNPRYGQRKWGSMGIPCPQTLIRIVDHERNEVAQGVTGEIALKSPAATIGYWQNDASSQALFYDGWLLTGDLAYFDEDGYLWFVGRKKLMIVRRGSNIAPAEVENVIDEHPLVHASVVVGMPDARDGHVPVACVAAMPNVQSLDADVLHRYVSDRLSAYKTPKYYLFLPELPRNATGKFDRHKLEELVISEFSHKCSNKTLKRGRTHS